MRVRPRRVKYAANVHGYMGALVLYEQAVRWRVRPDPSTAV
jgi:hypothetical protein